MKKVGLLFAIIIGLFFCSCKNITNQTADSEKSVGSVTVSISGEVYDIQTMANSRTVSPGNDVSYAEVTNWKVTFNSTAYTSTKTISKFSGTFVLPVGEYNVSVEGSITKNETTYYYVGSSEVNVQTSGNATASIGVGLKKTGTGNFLYQITLGDKFSADGIITPEITNKKTGDKISTEGFEISYTGDKKYSIGKTGMASGFYELKLYYQKTESSSKALIVLPDDIFEIADGCSTNYEGTTNIYKLAREYWATTAASDSNGLTKDYPANITSLLASLKEDTEWDEVHIYFEKGQDASGITISADDFGGRSVNIYYDNIQFVKDSEYLTTYYVTKTGKYEVSQTQTIDVAKTVKQMEDFVNKVDFSDKTVAINVIGHIYETEGSTFTKVKNFSIIGGSGKSPKNHDELSNMDVIDYQNKASSSGIDIENINGNVTIKNLKITGADGNNQVEGLGNVCNQFGGLKLGFGNNSEEKKIIISGCLFEECTGGSVAQGILLMGTTTKLPEVSIDNCIFQNCGQKDDTEAYDGGVIRIQEDVILSITNSEFRNNYADNISINDNASSVTSNTKITTENVLFKDKVDKISDLLSALGSVSGSTSVTKPITVVISDITTSDTKQEIANKVENIRTALIGNSSVYVNLDFSNVGFYTLEAFENSHELTDSEGNVFTGCGFTNATNLVEVTLPTACFTTLGNYAFSGCTNLTAINNTSNITSIGDTCFGNCKNLVSIELPNLTSSIPNAAFQNAKKLKTFEIPAGVSLIESAAFDGTTDLEKVIINGDGATVTGEESTGDQILIKQYAFRNSKIKKIICKGSGKITFRGGDEIFTGCTDVSIIAPLRSQLPDSMTTVKVFYGAVKTPEAGYIALTNETFIDATSYVDAKTEFGDDLILKLAGVVGNYNSSSKTAYIIGAETTEYPKKAWSEFTNQNFVDLIGKLDSGDADGSDNWTVICNVIGEEDLNVENYPAFKYALNFGNAFAGTVYATGWYVPTVNEISSCIRDNKVKINTALEKIGYKQIAGKILSSNQYASAIENCMTFDIGEAQVVAGTDGTTGNQSKATETQTCVIKKLTIATMQ